MINAAAPNGPAAQFNPCSATCDPASSRVLSQALTRYADTAGFNFANSQMNFVMQQQANWKALSDSMHHHDMAGLQAHYAMIRKMHGIS